MSQTTLSGLTDETNFTVHLLHIIIGRGKEPNPYYAFLVSGSI
ncbi:hypothetical protein SAMN05421788_106352 [Filimonas lacunae]|uniref:Uncharacterized protein n=1 Tax=Filimonas lacunae TaxID=477680 RepID=A0A173MFK8_9BACT|nr:hypothetical protein FLA_2302 [Filimonas lacunae]SIT25662.1 hypothetical protein SAMN05421788_106352 [Filimonas lacunae]